MKKIKSLSIIATVVVLGLTIIIGGYIYTTTDSYQAKKRYEALGDDYSVSQCDSIITKYPHTSYAELTKTKKRNLVSQQREWQSICQNVSLERVQEFKSKYQLTRQYAIAVENKLDSIYWATAQRNKTQKCYEDYLALGKMTRYYNDALHALQRMHNLPDPTPLAPQLQETIEKFYSLLSNKATTPQLLDLCTDTISRFFFRQNLTQSQLATYLNKTYHKNVQQREFKILTPIQFDKAYITDEKLGYAAMFDLQQEAKSKPVRYYHATVILNTEGKIMHVNAQRIFSKRK